MPPLFAMNDVSKSYGDRRVLENVTLALEPGTIVGLLGPNGAGKTTLLRCLLDLTKPSRGSIEVFGAPVTGKTFERVAYAFEESSLFLATPLGRMRVDDLFEFQRRSFGSRYDRKFARNLREQFGLTANARFNELSKGQRTAVWLSLAFAVRPQLLVLDEPASGLDPEHQRLVLDLMIDAAGNSKAGVLFSSHQVTHVERAADRVSVLRDGRIVLDAELESLRANERILRAVFDVPVPATNGLGSDPRVRKIERDERSISVSILGGEADIVRKLKALAPRAIDSVTPDLETIYLSTAGGAG